MQVSNSAQGDGVCFWPPDDPGGRREYAGHFVGGLRHGKGVMLFTDGTVYKGEWEKNAPNGFGQEFYPDGSSYKGRFHKDSRQGAGTYVTADKAAYPGIWRQGAWEKTLEPEAQAQLDEAMSRATTACDDAAQLNERLKICRSLRKHAPLHYRGPLLSILEAHNSAKADTEKAQEDEAAEEAAEEAICAQNTLLNSLISPRNKSLLQAVVQAPSVPSSDERQCASDLERQRLPDAHETMRLKKSGQVQLSKLRYLQAKVICIRCGESSLKNTHICMLDLSRSFLEACVLNSCQCLHLSNEPGP